MLDVRSGQWKSRKNSYEAVTAGAARAAVRPDRDGGRDNGSTDQWQVLITERKKGKARGLLKTAKAERERERERETADELGDGRTRSVKACHARRS